ncbi:MAG: outer membrane lipoprotein carrier protein LolA [Pseudomonadota bacterium]
MGIAFFTSVGVACAELALSSASLAATAATVDTAQVAQEATQAEVTPGAHSANSAASLGDAIVNKPVATPGAEDEALVFDGLSDDAVVEKVRAYIQSIKTLEADFTQVAPSGGVSSGKLYLRRPGQLRFEYEPPAPLLIVATQGNVYVEDKDLETTDFYPIKKTPLRFLLSKQVELGDAEVVGVDRGADTVAVTFASTGEETEGELSVILQAPNFALEQWIVRDVQNGITVVSLSNLEEGGRFRNSLFKAPEAGGSFLKN